MDKEAQTIDLEIEKLKLERLKVYGNVVTVLITVIIGTFGVASMNNALQNRQLKQQQAQNESELQLQQKKTEMELQLQQKKTESELQLQEKKAEAERQQAEMKYLGDFLTYALEEDQDKRLRFAEYFAALTISSDLQEKWKAYHTDLEALIVEAQRREEELAVAKQKGENEKVAELQKEVERLQAKLSALPERLSELPKISNVVQTTTLEDASRKRFNLDDEWRPLKYAENNFEVLNEIVIDHPAGLTWQRAGSENPLTYKQAQDYAEELNRQKFAGHDDWRLPTIIELTTLIEQERQSNDLYIDSVFDAKQYYCLSRDGLPSGSQWLVNFRHGIVYWDYLDDTAYVRVVRP